MWIWIINLTGIRLSNIYVSLVIFLFWWGRSRSHFLSWSLVLLRVRTTFYVLYTRRSSAENSGKNENMCVRWAVDEPLYCLSLCVWNDVRLFVHGRRKNQGRGEEEVSVIGKVLKFASARRLRREGGIIRPMIKFSIFYYINPIKKQFDTTSMYLLGTSPTKKTVPPPLYASIYLC